jgi:hypothetical protein
VVDVLVDLFDQLVTLADPVEEIIPLCTVVQSEAGDGRQSGRQDPDQLTFVRSLSYSSCLTSVTLRAMSQVPFLTL